MKKVFSMILALSVPLGLCAENWKVGSIVCRCTFWGAPEI